MDITALSSLVIKEESSCPQQVLGWYMLQHAKCLTSELTTRRTSSFLIKNWLVCSPSINPCKVHTGWYTGTLSYLVRLFWFGNWLPRFWHSLSVPSSRVKQSKKSLILFLDCSTN